MSKTSVPAIDSSKNPDPPKSELTPFLIGISGHMKLVPDQECDLKEHFRRFYRWLRTSDRETVPGVPLGPGLNLKKTPIWVLTSMAPGVDQIAAEIAMEFKFRVVAPLPFPLLQYKESTTFSKELHENELQGVSELPHEAFYVALASEQKLTPAEAEAAREDCLQNKPNASKDAQVETANKARTISRHQHQRAAGEYVAAYCDLLLAVTSLDSEKLLPTEPATFDPSHDYDPGTPAIVRVRQRGITPGMLPVEPDFPWADTGPVVYLPWQKCGDPAPSDAGTFRYLATAEFETEVLRETAEYVEKFNRNFRSAKAKAILDKKTVPGDGMREMTEMFGGKLPPDSAPLQPQLLRIAGARSRAKSVNYAMDDLVKKQRDHFLLLAVLTAVFLQFADGWTHEDSSRVDILHSLRDCSFWFALGCAIAAVFYLWRFRRSRYEHDQIDSRCIMEGLRVQFYWAASGTGVSAASNYLLRQRGSIRWIINSISSASFPYEASRDAFRKLGLAQRLTLLEQAIKGWISGQGKKPQIGYYHDAIQKIKHEQPQYQFQGWVCLGACVLVGIYGVAAGHGVIKPFIFSSDSMGCVLVISTLLCLVIARALPLIPWSGGKSTAKLAAERKSPVTALLQPALWLEHPENKPNPESDWAICWYDFIPLKPLPLGKPQALESRLRTMRWLGFVLLYAAGLSSALIGLACCLGPMADWIPTPVKMLGMLKNILAALAARAFLASSLRFHTENLRNYEAMHALFTKGNERLQHLLAKLKEQLNPEPTEPPKLPDPAGAEQTIQAIQAQMVALGKEALSEHAEWLHLHRDRPVTTNLPTG